MTETDIQKGLRSLFMNNDYHLFNQYIFNHEGESDYFSITKSGLLIEVEVKISRSDFFADFKKPKHKYLKFLLGKQSHIVENMGLDIYSGDILAKYKMGILEEENIWIRQTNHWFYNTRIRHRIVEVRAPFTRIHIREMKKLLLPNRFYFATPPGLIKPEEVPPYAGLIEMKPLGLDYVKKSPVLHRNELPAGFWKTILDKYYFKHRELITRP